jgi:acyl transferase domain-containing protein
MSDFAERLAALTPKQLTLLALELRDRLDEANRRRSEPVAVVGIGCRFPGGADSPETFHRMLMAGRDGVTDVPSDRWDAAAWYDPDPDVSGKMICRRGAFLSGIDRFDADFFGISPREAASLDPQQRLLLEVTWEALEHANIAPPSLAGSRTGVFVGISVSDYRGIAAGGNAADEADLYAMTGTALNAASGRLSHSLGLHGPSLVIDTACSSSLTAIHLAVRSLRDGECRAALAGGVNVVLSPLGNVVLSRARMLAADGKCKTFDASADGYVRGEGCGMVVLKKLSDAAADGDRILAVIRGSAINHDGTTSGFTVPNGLAQRELIRAAIADAGVPPSSIGYVEAHGTGTALGDPIEVNALLDVLNSGRPADRPLLLGTVKTNLGHLESAAGIAGFIKLVLAVQHGEVPPHLHFRELNPHIDRSGLLPVIPTKPTPWPATNNPRVGCVSSFGASGTNVNVVIEQPPTRPATASDTRGVGECLLCLSAKSEGALRELAGRYAMLLSSDAAPSLADVCVTAFEGRARFPWRLAVVAATAREAAERLGAFATGDAAGVRVGRASGTPPAPPTAPAPLDSLAVAFVAGCDLDRSAVCPAGNRVADLPTYPFQRQRHWLAAASLPLPPRYTCEKAISPTHPLLGRKLRTATPIFETELAEGSPPYLADHRLFGSVLLPASGFIELALAAVGDSPMTLTDLTIREPLVLSPDSRRTVQTLVTQRDGNSTFEIMSRPGNADEEITWVRHCTGNVLRGEGETRGLPRTGFDPARVREEYPEELSTDNFYAEMSKAGVEFGPTFRGLKQLFRGPAGTACRIEINSDAAGYRLHPALLDAGLQLLAVALRDAGSDGETRIPVGVKQLRVLSPASTSVWARAATRTEAGGPVGDLTLFDDFGHVVAELTGVEFKSARGLVKPKDDEQLKYRIEWQPQDRPTLVEAAAGPGWWLVLTDDAGLGQQVADWVEVTGRRCRVVPANTTDPVSLAMDTTDGPCHSVVYFGSLDGMSARSTTAATLTTEVRRTCERLLTLVQGLADQATPPRLWIITRGAQPAGTATGPTAVAQAAVWGLARTVVLEYPAMNCTCVDLDPTSPPDEASELYAELRLAPSEPQVAFRGTQRLVPRLVRVPEIDANAGSPAFRLEVTQPGVLDGLLERQFTRIPPGPGQVEIEVHATGLNFRDVLVGLGAMSGPTANLGHECSGVVVAVGPSVNGLSVGQRVVAVGPNCFATHVTTLAELVSPLPDGFDLTTAAAIPVAALTASITLETLAGLKAGEKVLIHAAAGGVGLAAVHLAIQLGAEVIATAGTPEKRDYLHGLGVRYVFDSRTTVFADDVRRVTGGRGVDVVLNSLSGEFIPRNLESLAPNGRFVEIGKLGIWAADRMKKVRPDVMYSVFDLGEHIRRDAAVVGAALRKAVADTSSGRMPSPPTKTFSSTETGAAFRHMQQAKHIGKVVVVRERSTGPSGFQPVGTYLVVGGLSGAGLLTAKWLAERGVRSLVLCGRSTPSAEAVAAVNELQRQGVTVQTVRTDVSDEASVAELFRTLDSEGPPLRGVIHAAAVYDDALLAATDWPRTERVLAPKAWGGWLLHEATRERELDCFVLFSSASAVLGAAGQGAYTAANAVLDSLAHHRRSMGLPGLSVGWGPWAATGEAARRELGGRYEGQGFRPLEARRYLAELNRLFAGTDPHAIVVSADWPLILSGGTPPVLAEQAKEVGAAQPGAAVALLPRLLRGLPQTERYGVILGHLNGLAAKILGCPPGETLDPYLPFSELGMDSLMALELRNAVSYLVGTPLSAMVMFNYPTLDAIAQFLDTEVLPQDVAAPTGKDTDADYTSDGQVEENLLRELRDAGY